MPEIADGVVLEPGGQPGRDAAEVMRVAGVLVAAPVGRRHLDDPEVEQHGPGGVQEAAVVGPVPAAALAPGPERRFGVVQVADGKVVQAAAGLDQQPDDDPLGRPGADVRGESQLGGGLLVSVEVRLQPGAAGELDQAGELAARPGSHSRGGAGRAAAGR